MLLIQRDELFSTAPDDFLASSRRPAACGFCGPSSTHARDWAPRCRVFFSSLFWIVFPSILLAFFYLLYNFRYVRIYNKILFIFIFVLNLCRPANRTGPSIKQCLPVSDFGEDDVGIVGDVRLSQSDCCPLLYRL